LVIEGYHFGPVLAAGRSDIVVRYGKNITDTSTYTLDNSDPLNGLFVPCKITEYDDDTKKGTMQCQTKPGVGKNHYLQVQVGKPYTTDCPSNGCTVKTSEYFQARIKYGRPIVASYTVGGDPATNMATSGDEDLVVVGSNFGPAGTPVDAAIYGDDGGGNTPGAAYAATGCTVVGHTQMNCKTAAGAGANHKLVVTIADQQSTVPAVGYGAPSVHTSECDHAGGTNPYQCNCTAGQGDFGTTCSGYEANGKWYVPAVTIGTPLCAASAGCTAPIATLMDASNGYSLSTRGGQRIQLSGTNVGGTAPDGTETGTGWELTEVHMGPSSTVSRRIPLVNSSAVAAWRSGSVVPGCVLDVPHFSLLCNTPPGIGRDNYFFLTVSGQTMVVGSQGPTSYNLPNVETLTAENNLIRTNGGDMVVLEGLDFGAAVDGVSIEAWLFREGVNTAQFKSGAGSGLVVALDETNKPGKDIVAFPVPTGYGRYNVYVRIVDTLTGQSEMSSNFVPLVYDKPKITGSNTVQKSADNEVSITGDNFCSDHLVNQSGCGELFVCTGVATNGTGGCGACFNGDPPILASDPPQTIKNPNNAPLGRTTLWGHGFVRVSTTSSGGCVYVRVGTNPLNYQYSNAYVFVVGLLWGCCGVVVGLLWVVVGGLGCWFCVH
jgi:hypothetical protein